MFSYYLIAPHSFQTKQTRSSFYFNNDKTRACILKENDFKEPENDDTRNLTQSDLKLVNYHTLHNRGIGTLKQNDHKIG